MSLLDREATRDWFLRGSVLGIPQRGREGILLCFAKLREGWCRTTWVDLTVEQHAAIWTRQLLLALTDFNMHYKSQYNLLSTRLFRLRVLGIKHNNCVRTVLISRSTLTKVRLHTGENNRSGNPPVASSWQSTTHTCQLWSYFTRRSSVYYIFLKS